MQIYSSEYLHELLIYQQGILLIIIVIIPSVILTVEIVEIEIKIKIDCWNI